MPGAILNRPLIRRLSPDRLRPPRSPGVHPRPPEAHPFVRGTAPMASRPKIRRRRRTKIIATLGPASSTPEILARLFQAGADIFRLNFSHGTHEDHAARV